MWVSREFGRGLDQGAVGGGGVSVLDDEEEVLEDVETDESEEEMDD